MSTAATTTQTITPSSVDKSTPPDFGKSLQNYDHLYMIDDIPVTYILEKLRLLGPSYYSDKATAFAELRVQGIDKPFWIHKEYLVLQSRFFQEVFKQITNGDVITIKVPFPEVFEIILKFLYDGDGNKWYGSMTKENFFKIWRNVEFLQLGNEAKAVCNAYYVNVLKKS
ncbi:14882_t:CDS:1 [Entrophospora sp. SA101]|nr:5060_t:CDS:1 [Entrophospora sp. SA101]CAJ0646417.1 10802_t:CDS:1 [Entrophospora sp. SA101]CAJ0753098.1 171_t:CDS:1 [Entrophospora sp. SA101]CAJ0760724.1 14882_t:CDS:1 [Entrophospora sp. SA101]CAJ0837190.1 10491_t:CDS:1 [Entrophospora sp. SA101]